MNVRSLLICTAFEMLLNRVSLLPLISVNFITA